MRKNQAGLERVNKALSADSERLMQRELRLTAYHEAGHVMAHALLGKGGTILVTLADNDEVVNTGSCYGRGFSGTEPERIRKKMIALAAGAEAMRRHDPRSDGGGREAAVDLFGYLASPKRLDREIGRARRQAEKLVKAYWPEIETTAQRLIDNHLFLAAARRRTVPEF